MKRQAMFIFFLVLLIGFTLYAFAPHIPSVPKDVESVTEMEAYLNRLTASGNPPGLSVVVVRDGEIIYKNAFGYADGLHKVKAAPETVYHWWSMTKIPTAIAIMQLQEQGKLNLDDKVTKHLPWFEVNYPSRNSQTITIRHLMQHTSGLPNPVPAMIGWVHYDDVTPNQTEVLKKYLPEFNNVKFEPGSKAVYGNLNYMILGAVIEAVSGQTYEEYIVENILAPLGMPQTDFIYTPEISAYEAAGSIPLVHFFTPLLPALLDTNALVRQRDGKLLWMNRVYIEATPSTGLIGSAPNAAKLMLAYLNRGTLNGQLILSPESIAALTNTPPINGRGLGWAVGELDGELYLEHGGGGPGFAATMRLYPERGLGIVILTNGTDLDRDGLAELFTRINY
jgi:CubicO group peptidase (beta-lactamase class C family)